MHTGTGEVIPDGVMIIRGGKIDRVGPRGSTAIPDGLRVVSTEGKHVTPGFIDLHSRLFLGEGDLRDHGGAESRSVMDALDLFDPFWPLARAQGITTVAIAPGTSQGAGGLGAVLKLGATEAEVLRRESHFVAALGVSGERSTSAERLEQYYRLRGLSIAAQEYKKAWDVHWKAVEKYNDELKKRLEAEQKAEADKKGAKKDDKTGDMGDGKKPEAPPPAPESAAPKPPERPKPPRAPAVDAGREALLRALAGKLPVFVEAHRRDDLEYAVLLKKEFGLKLVVLGATQGHLHAETIARADVPVAVEPALLDRWALEYREHTEANAALLSSAKVTVALSSSGVGGLASRRLRIQALAAVRGGLPREEALRAITSVPARLLGLEARIGSLEAGKDADFVVLSGEPMDARSRVEWVSTSPCGLGAGPAPRGLEASAQRPGGDLPPSPLRPAPSPLILSAPSPLVLSAPASREIPTVLANARIVTPDSDRVLTIDHATIILRGGRIEAVGSAGAVKVPEGAEVVNLDGKWVLPGFIDAHSHAGLGGETDDVALAISEDLRVLDAFDPWDPEIPRLLGRGVTTCALSPGGINVVGGRISLVKLVPGEARLRVVDPAAGVKASLVPALSLPRYPTSLGGATRAFEGWARGDRPRSSRGKVPVLVEVPSRAAAERALAALGDVGSPVALVDPGRLTAAAWERLRPGCTVILGPYGLGDPSSKLRAAAALRKEGARIAFAMGATRRDLLTTAILAVEGGLDRDDAFLALTAWPAALYGADGRLGAVATGADADLVVWSGDPFSLAARVEMVFVDGKKMEIDVRGPGASEKPRARPEGREGSPADRAFSGGLDAATP